MNEMIKTPEFLFESSWEVCNKVGGIYTVLSTKAHTLQQIFNDKVIFIGPDVWANTTAPDFTEDASLFEDWRKHAEAVDHLKVKVGRWNVPGTPPVILVDFKSYFSERDAFFYSMWENFRVDSIHAYGDYDESCIFAYAVGKVIESFYHFYKLENKKVAALFNEWMLAMGALYIQKQIPAIATLFTTHATSIGRSIAGNDKALYAYMDGYNGDQMARITAFFVASSISLWIQEQCSRIFAISTMYGFRPALSAAFLNVASCIRGEHEQTTTPVSFFSLMAS